MLAQLEKQLQQHSNNEDVRFLKSLLYHRDWYIRREVAFLIDMYGVPLDEKEQLQFAFALQNFQYLKQHISHPYARQLLFQACGDASPRIRARVLEYLHLNDCHTPLEEAWLHYAAGDYTTLLELGCTEEYQQAVIQVLQHGLHQTDNPPYHRRQCAFCLEKLKAIEDAQQSIQKILQEQDNDGHLDNPETTPPESLSPVQRLLLALQQQGIWLDGRRVFPEVHQVSRTGRITYRQPAIQTFSPEERLKRLRPPQDKGMLFIYDYVAMEPTLLMHFLVQRFLMSLADVPENDIYLAIDPQNREKAKEWLNAVINGGGRRYAQNLNPFQLRLWEAVQQLRQELWPEVQQKGYVETLGGQQIPIHPEEPNVLGRMMNYLIQGSAADIFNRAVAEIHWQLKEHMLSAGVYFLLFDEVWILGAPDQWESIHQLCQDVLHTIPRNMGLLVPLKTKVNFFPEPENKPDF